GSGFLHLAWGGAELDFAERLLEREWQLREPVAEIWRSLAASDDEAEGARLRMLLEGESGYPRPAEVAARCVLVLVELGLCEWTGDRAARRLRVLSSERTDLGRSRAYVVCAAGHEEALRFLQSRAQE
ncbi:MAG: hypothetical protein ACJ75I_04025, partial [Solirubrobacterales bacterium]